MRKGPRTIALSTIGAGLLGASTLVDAEALSPAPQTNDSRILLTIPFDDRENMMREMRNNLDQVRRMVVAFAENDFDAIARIADEISLHKKRSKAVVRRGNPAFTQMAVQFHGVLAPQIRHAAETREPKRVADAINAALTACVSCHETFRLTEWPQKRYARPEPIPLNLPEGARIMD